MSLDLLKQVVRGSAMHVKVSVRDLLVSPARPYDPDGSVRVTYYTPDGAVHPDVSSVMMSHVAGIVGEYEFAYQSTSTDPLGTWAVEVQSTHQGLITVYPERGRFELVLAT